jgi:pilus assembly protein CpaB
MLVEHSVPSRAIPLNAVLDANEIIGKWTLAGYGISKNSFIYEEKIVEQSELPDAGLLELKEDEVAVPLLVNLESSLGNSIIPNTHIDLYFQDIVLDDNDKKALYGKLISNVRVVAVKNAQASDVFDVEGYNNGQKNDTSNNNSKTMAKIYIFAVPSEMGGVVNKAKMLGNVIPIATGKSYFEDIDTVLESNEVVQYIQDSTFGGDQEYEMLLEEEQAEEGESEHE